MGQQKVWRSVWRGTLWRLFVVIWQDNVWCVCVAFCVERCVVEVICGDMAALRLVCVHGVLCGEVWCGGYLW